MRQNFVVIDYTKELILLASIKNNQKEIVVGMGQIARENDSLTAEVAFAVRDDYQNNGIGTELLSFLTTYARREGFHGFTAEVLVENNPMLHVFEKMHRDITKTIDSGSYHLAIRFGVKDGKE
jgi:RimJ/RimL family protein N-acetyltransferase